MISDTGSDDLKNKGEAYITPQKMKQIDFPGLLGSHFLDIQLKLYMHYIISIMMAYHYWNQVPTHMLHE